MANRSYLYSLSNRPSSYEDRPDTISGLSEWAYAVPFSYRVLMSGDPQLCSSLISDGFEDESQIKKSKLYAISSDFDMGLARIRKFFSVLRPIVESESPKLTAGLDTTLEFLEAHHDRYLLLETIELDCMTHDGEANLRSCVETEIHEILGVGAAVDALPQDPAEAGKRLRNAVLRRCDSPFDKFFGLRLDDDCDSVRERKTKYPLGLWWDETLYFSLWNRAEFEANRST